MGVSSMVASFLSKRHLRSGVRPEGHSKCIRMGLGLALLIAEENAAHSEQGFEVGLLPPKSGI
jgi:hypothetical protein